MQRFAAQYIALQRNAAPGGAVRNEAKRIAGVDSCVASNALPTVR
jgi:hypothetical protein